jgi:L-fuconolactonase
MAKHYQGAFSKRFDGREEAIIDPALPIIDAHHHLYDRPNLRYLLDEYLSDAGAGHNIVGSVYIETKAMARSTGPDHLRPIGEIEFANGVGAMAASGRYGPCRACAAIVGYAELSAGDAVAELLDRAMATAPDRFRGVREMAFHHPSEALKQNMALCRPGILTSDGFQRGFRHLGPRGLSFDASIFHNQLPELRALADRFPDTLIILNHIGLAVCTGLAPDAREEVLDAWRSDLFEIARRPNIVCKIGGLGVPVWGFGFERRPDPVGYLELSAVWRPYVETAIEVFGVDRCMMESDYPSEGIACGYVPQWNALKDIVRSYSASEKSALFHDVAAKAYRIDLEAS